MIRFKSRLNKEDKEKISNMILTLSDEWGEFYVTKNNLRLYLKQNIDIVFSNLKKGDKIIYNENAIVIVTGFSDNYERHYIKFLVKDLKLVEDLLKSISWNLKIDFWAKLKKRNPLVEVLERNGFEFYRDRGKEILLVRKYIKKDK